MADITKRLKSLRADDHGTVHVSKYIIDDAFNEIERLRAEIQHMQANDATKEYQWNKKAPPP